MKRIAVVPARSGSKRLPGKNFKLFAGKPLIHWTILAAIESEIFDTIFVSTDSTEIASYAEAVGASAWPLRPDKFSLDSSKSTDVVEHVFEMFPQHDVLGLLQPTSPLRNANHILEAYSMLVEGFDSVVSAEIISRGSAEIVSIAAQSGRYRVVGTPDKTDETFARLNGAIYFTLRDTFQRHGSLVHEGTAIFPMASESSVDIDTENDFSLAEQLFMRGRSET